jgi:sporulation integral membrane protein YtvI
LGTFFVFLVIQLISQVISIGKSLPQVFAMATNAFNSLVEKGAAAYDWLPVGITEYISSFFSDLSNTLSRFLDPLLKGALSTAISLPGAIIFVITVLLSTYYMTGDRDKISGVLKAQLPTSWYLSIRDAKESFFTALFGYLRALFILMCITFAELYIGFTIIGIRYAFALAFITSIIDAIPVFGTAIVLLPWAAYSFISGNPQLGAALLILYAIVLIGRQLIEPKILGRQLGAHPLLTLFGMYVGSKILGFTGLILGPIAAVVLKGIITGLAKEFPVHSPVFEETGAYGADNMYSGIKGKIPDNENARSDIGNKISDVKNTDADAKNTVSDTKK